jgi:hypothetical protein
MTIRVYDPLSMMPKLPLLEGAVFDFPGSF